jgi:hypothetical protein
MHTFSVKMVVQTTRYQYLLGSTERFRTEDDTHVIRNQKE